MTATSLESSQDTKPTRSISSLSVATALVMLVVLVQLGALTAIAVYAHREFLVPAAKWWRYINVFASCVDRGELIYYVSNTWGTGIFQVEGFDLTTGRIRKIEGLKFFPNRGFIRIGDRLWAIGNQDVYETDGKTEQSYRPGRIVQRPFGRCFIYDGYPALTDCDDADVCRLLVLVNGEWEERAEIAMPGDNRTWFMDGQTGELRLAPRATFGSESAATESVGVHVVSVRGQQHLFVPQFDDYRGTKRRFIGLAYRVGFDQMAPISEGAPVSALAPENALVDTTGWVLLKPDFGPNVIPVALRVFAIDDQLFVFSGRKIWRMTSAGESSASIKFEPIDCPVEFDFMSLSLDSDEAYFLTHNFYFRNKTDDIEISRFDGERLTKLPRVIDGSKFQIKQFQIKKLLQVFGVLGAGIVAVALIALGFVRDSDYGFGNQTVTLASVWRRILARCIDMLLILAPLAIWLVLQFSMTSIRTLTSLDQNWNLLIFGAIWFVVGWLGIVTSMGAWGTTPGKWLFGVRVVQTTLRRCGVVRAALREVLFWVDAPQLLSVVPGVICLLITERHQRIGDVVADTLVINTPIAARTSMRP